MLEAASTLAVAAWFVFSATAIVTAVVVASWVPIRRRRRRLDRVLRERRLLERAWRYRTPGDDGL